MKEQESRNLDTPMMRQYLDIKKEYQEEILFFRMGDFYEMFLDDAVYASRVLDIALTKRQDSIPMCGIPHHAMQNYVHKILESGKNIAICDQLENPQEATGHLVRRKVTRVLTPGSLYEEGLLDDFQTRKIASLLPYKEGMCIAAVVDISTAALFFASVEVERISGFLEAHSVRELVTVIDFSLPYLKVDRIHRKAYSTEMKKEFLQKYISNTNILLEDILPSEQDAFFWLLSFLQ